MPASNGEIRGDLHERQVAESDADERADVGLAALRHGYRDRNAAAGGAILQYGLLACALVGLIGSLVMAAQEK
jgi:hypothetical protein